VRDARTEAEARRQYRLIMRGRRPYEEFLRITKDFDEDELTRLIRAEWERVRRAIVWSGLGVGLAVVAGELAGAAPWVFYAQAGAFGVAIVCMRWALGIAEDL
jgi:hypothetical protein